MGDVRHFVLFPINDHRAHILYSHDSWWRSGGTDAFRWIHSEPRQEGIFLFFSFFLSKGSAESRSKPTKQAISKFLWAIEQHVPNCTITYTQVFIIMQMSAVSFRAQWFHLQLFSFPCYHTRPFLFFANFIVFFLVSFFFFFWKVRRACWIKVIKREFQRMLCFETANEQQLIKRIYKTESVMSMPLVPFKVSALWISLNECNIIRAV